MRLHKIDGRLQVIFIMKSNSIGYRKRSWYLPFLSENTWQTHQQFSFLWNGIKHYSLSRSKAAAKVMIVKWDERIVSKTMSNTLSDSARRNIRNRFGCYHQPKLSGEKWRKICFKRKIWPDYRVAHMYRDSGCEGDRRIFLNFFSKILIHQSLSFILVYFEPF